MEKNHKLAEKYNPKDFEESLYNEWEKNGYFKPSMDKTKKSYTIVMPPPNVTGKLHMGHALDAALQDLLLMKDFQKQYILHLRDCMKKDIFIKENV